MTWVRRSEIERLRKENADLKRQYSERVALERRNLKALEDKYNELRDDYLKLSMAIGNPIASSGA